MRFKDRMQYSAISLVAFVLGITIYGTWWFSANRLNTSVPYGVSLMLFAILTFVIWHRPVLELYSWVVARKIRPQTEQSAPDGFKVAMITTFVPGAEPLDMLERTLTAMLEADYPHDVWVLDEGNDDAAKALCKRIGVHHFSRKGIVKYNTRSGIFAAKTKGGNHNAWYDAHGHAYDIVSQWDTDFVVKKSVLTDVLGYFADPLVAFVGSPQVYGNMDSWIARGAAEQTYLFYGAIMRGLGDRGEGLLIGANHTVRVTALKEVGWYFAHLAEDLATGMTFHSHGWTSVYTHKVLAVGEGPTTWSAYFKQQHRWASGCLDLLLRHSIRLSRSMNIKQAARYLWMQTFYLNGLTMLLGVALLVLYFSTGIAPATISLQDLVIFYGPILVWRQVMMLWLQKLNARPYMERGMLWAGRFITIAALPVYLMASIGALMGKKVTFKVTPKGEGEKRESVRVFRVHFWLSGTLLSAMAIGLLLGHSSWVFIAWGICGSVSLLAFPLATILAGRRFRIPSLSKKTAAVKAVA